MSFRTKKSLDIYCKSSYILLVVAACAITSNGDKTEATVGKPKIVSTGVGTTGGGNLGSSSIQKSSSIKGGNLSSGISGNVTVGSSRRSSISSVGSVTSQQSGSIETGGVSSIPTGKVQHRYGVSEINFNVVDLKDPIDPDARYVQFVNTNGQLVTYKEGLSAKLKLLWKDSEIGRDKYIGPDGKIHTYIYRSRPNWVSGSDIIKAQGGDGGSSDLPQQQGNIFTNNLLGNKSSGTQTDIGISDGDGSKKDLGTSISPKRYTSRLYLDIGKDGRVTQSKGTNTVIDGDGKGIGKPDGTITSLGQDKGSGTGGLFTTRILLNKNIQTEEDMKTSSVVTSSVQTIVSGSDKHPRKRINKGIGTQTDQSITGEGSSLSGSYSDSLGEMNKENNPASSVVYRFGNMPHFVVNEDDKNKEKIPVKSVVHNFGKIPRFVPRESSAGIGDTNKKDSVGVGTIKSSLDDSGTNSGGTYVSTLKVNFGGKKSEQTGTGDEKKVENKYLQSLADEHGSLLLRKDVSDDGFIVTTDYTKQILGTGDPVVVSRKSSSITDKGKSSTTGTGGSLEGEKQTQGLMGERESTGGKKSSTLVVEIGESSEGSKLSKGTGKGSIKGSIVTSIDKGESSSIYTNSGKKQTAQVAVVEDTKSVQMIGGKKSSTLVVEIGESSEGSKLSKGIGKGSIKGSIVTSIDKGESSSIYTNSGKKQTAQVVVVGDTKSAQTTGGKKSSTLVVEIGESSSSSKGSKGDSTGDDSSSMTGNQGGGVTKPVSSGGKVQTLSKGDTGKKLSSTLVGQQEQGGSSSGINFDEVKRNLKPVSESGEKKSAGSSGGIDFNEAKRNLKPVSDTPGDGGEKYKAVLVEVNEEGEIVEKQPIQTGNVSSLVSHQQGEGLSEGADGMYKAVLVEVNEEGEIVGEMSRGEKKTTSSSLMVEEEKSSLIIGGSKSKVSKSSTLETVIEEGSSSSEINIEQARASLKEVSISSGKTSSGSSLGIDFDKAKKNLKPVPRVEKGGQKTGFDESDIQKARAALKKVPIGQGLYDSDSDDDDDVNKYILTGKNSGMATGGRNKIDFQRNVKTDDNLINSQGKEGFVNAAVEVFNTMANEDGKIKVSNQTGNINVETGTDESGNVRISKNTTTSDLENVGPLNVNAKFAKKLAKDIYEGYKKKLQEMEERGLN